MWLAGQANQLETQSNSLSVKLLKSIGSTFDSQGQKPVINNLRGLSNRIKQANLTYGNKAQLKTTTQHWIKEKGVNLTELQQQVITVHEQQRKLAILESIEEQKELKDNPLEPSLKDLPLDDFSFQCEENIAYRAILVSMNHPSGNNRVNPLKKITRDNFKKISGRLIEQPQSQSFSNTNKQELVEVIQQYGDLVKQGTINSLHQRLYTAFEHNFRESKKWIPLICCQIAMALNFNLDTSTTISPKNYLAVVSLEALEKLFKEKFDRNKSKVIGNYKQGEQYIEEDPGSWREMFFLLRSGQKSRFLEEIQAQDKVVAENIQIVLQELEYFKKGEPYFSDIVISSHMSIYERILKLIATSTFQSIFQECDTATHCLDEPWLLLMTLGLSGGRLSEKSREKEFNKAVNQYFRLAKSKVTENLNDQGIISLIIGLMALGKYQFIFRFYDELEQVIRQNSIWVELIHLFILLLSNPSVVYLQSKQHEGEEIINRCVEQVVNYLNYLKDAQYLEEFNTYICYLSSALGNLVREKENFPYKELINEHCLSLIVSIGDLKVIDLGALSQQNNKASRYFLTSILNSIPLKNEDQYIKLSERCGEVRLQELQEHLLVQLIIFHYNSLQQQTFSPQQHFIGHPTEDKLRQSKRLVEDVEVYLQNNMNPEDKIILYFLKKLRELRECVQHRNKERLETEEKEFAKYRKNFEGVMKYLSKIDPYNTKGHQDIIVLYIQKLFQMYRIIFLNSRNRNDLTQYKQNLLSDLKIYQNQYPEINKDVVGQVTELLRQ